MVEQRPYDVVVFGATGFVGRLTAEYLAGNAPPTTRVALAGRSKERVEQVRSSLGSRAADWAVVVADSADPASLAEMAGQTTTVATTVGPYASYGLPLVEACAEAGTHYADLTGELTFMRKAIDRYHDTAAASGARIVPTCGFDSIPSDLGVFALHEKVRADGAGDLGETTFVVTGLKGGVSGGTIATMKTGLAEMRSDPSVRRLMGDPYALSPARGEEPTPGDGPDLRLPTYDAKLRRWLGPFVMAGVNTRVVRRSNALQQWSYGRGFRYREVMGFGAGPVGLAQAAAVTGGLAALAGGLMLAPTRAMLDRVLPSPGEGPSEKTQRNGYFRIEIHTTTSTGARYVCDVSAQGDPGYAATAVMLGETALALAHDGAHLPATAGVLTPAAALGMPLVERLRARRFTIDARRL